MPRVKDRLVGELREPVDEAVVHGLWIAAREVSSSAASEEQRVAGDEAPFYKEALASGRMARSVQQVDGDGAHLEDVAAVVGDDGVPPDARRRRDPLDLVVVGVDRDCGLLQERGDADDRVAEEVASDMIGMMVRGEHARETHAIRIEDGENRSGVVSRVDRHRLTGFAVADEIDEIHHLLGDGILTGEVASASS